MTSELELGLLHAQIKVQQLFLDLVKEEIDTNINQLLSSIKIILGITERRLFPISDTLKTAQETLTTAIHDLHSLSSLLDKQTIDNFNLIQILALEVKRINYWKKVSIFIKSEVDILPLTQSKQLILLLVIMTALEISIEQARAKFIRLSVLCEAELEITISDDGKFLDNGLPQGKDEIKMEHFTRLIGGEIAWSTRYGAGSTVQILIPINSQNLCKLQ